VAQSCRYTPPPCRLPCQNHEPCGQLSLRRRARDRAGRRAWPRAPTSGCGRLRWRARKHLILEIAVRTARLIDHVQDLLASPTFLASGFFHTRLPSNDPLPSLERADDLLHFSRRGGRPDIKKDRIENKGGILHHRRNGGFSGLRLTHAALARDAGGIGGVCSDWAPHAQQASASRTATIPRKWNLGVEAAPNHSPIPSRFVIHSQLDA